MISLILGILLLWSLVSAQLTPTIMQGFPVYCQNPPTSSGGRGHGAIIDDIDQDGKPNFILGGRLNEGTGNNEIFVYEYSNGQPVLEYRLVLPSVDDEGTVLNMSHGPAVCDGDGDGYKEIVVVAGFSINGVDEQCGGDNVSCTDLRSRVVSWDFRASGPLLTISQAFHGGFGTPVAADVTGGDGDDELIFVGPERISLGPNGNHGSWGLFTILDRANGSWSEVAVNGTNIAEWRNEEQYYWIPIAEPAVADLDLDGLECTPISGQSVV